MRHYELITTDTVTSSTGATLYRIRALIDLPWHNVKAGDLGGYIERVENLQDRAWVGVRAQVEGSARVSDLAYVAGNAQVFDWARVSGRACVSGNVQVLDRAHVFGDAWVYGSAHVSGDANIQAPRERKPK